MDLSFRFVRFTTAGINEQGLYISPSIDISCSLVLDLCTSRLNHGSSEGKLTNQSRD